MASAMGNYFENLILNWLFKAGSIPSTPGSSGTIYIALFTASPAGDVTTNEISTSGTAYARQSVAANLWNYTPSTSSTPAIMSNSTAIQYTQASSNWGTVSHVAVVSSASGATNFYYWGALTNQQVVNSGSTFSFAINSLVVNLT